MGLEGIRKSCRDCWGLPTATSSSSSSSSAGRRRRGAVHYGASSLSSSGQSSASATKTTRSCFRSCFRSWKRSCNKFFSAIWAFLTGAKSAPVRNTRRRAAAAAAARASAASPLVMGVPPIVAAKKVQRLLYDQLLEVRAKITENTKVVAIVRFAGVVLWTHDNKDIKKGFNPLLWDFCYEPTKKDDPTSNTDVRDDLKAALAEIGISPALKLEVQLLVRNGNGLESLTTETSFRNDASQSQTPGNYFLAKVGDTPQQAEQRNQSICQTAFGGDQQNSSFQYLIQ